MTEIGSIINTVARTAVITNLDMVIIMVATISIILLQNIFTGTTKNGMGTINAGIIPEIDITIAGTKSIINAGIIPETDITIAGTKSIINAGTITGIDITIGRVIRCPVVIMAIIMHAITGPLWDLNLRSPDLNLRLL
jgi:hypothetical protein